MTVSVDAILLMLIAGIHETRNTAMVISVGNDNVNGNSEQCASNAKKHGNGMKPAQLSKRSQA